MRNHRTFPEAIFSRHAAWILLLALAVAFAPACKSKKKLAEQQRQEEMKAAEEARQAQIAQLKAELEALMASPVRDLADLRERERRLAQIKAMQVEDAGVMAAIRKVEYFLEQERKRLEQAAQPSTPPAPDPAERLRGELESAFRDIASAGSTAAANSRIQQALALFASPDAPVLIVIHQAGGQKDYDRPTTIREYLNYLKDQRKAPAQIQELQLDANGRIRELELVKP